MSLMWMPAQTTVPPGATRAQGKRDELAGGGEDDRRVERLGQPGLAGLRTSEPPSVSPAQAAPSSSAKRWSRRRRDG